MSEKERKKVPSWFSEWITQELKKYKGREIEDCICLRILRQGYEGMEGDAVNEVHVDITQSPDTLDYRTFPITYSPTKSWFIVSITDWSVDNANGFEKKNPEMMSEADLNAYYNEFKNSEIVSSEQTCWPADNWGECKFIRHEELK